MFEGLDMHEILGASSEQLLSKEAFLAFEMSFFRAGIRLEAFFTPFHAELFASQLNGSTLIFLSSDPSYQCCHFFSMWMGIPFVDKYCSFSNFHSNVYTVEEYIPP